MDKFHGQNSTYVKTVTLLVSDIKQSLDFYTKILGLKVICVKNDKVYRLGTFTDKALINLITSDDVVSKDKTTGLYHFALLVPNFKMLGIMIKHLIAINYHFAASNHHVSNAIYLNDPDGNGIEIYADTNDNDWIWHANEVTMVTERLDLKPLLNLAKDEKFTRIFDDTKLGHLHLHVNSLVEAKKFYGDVLGFTKTLNYYGALFMATNSYHHHLGLNIWNGTNNKNRDNNMVGLVSYQLHVPPKQINGFIKRLNDNEIHYHQTNKFIVFKDINNQTVMIKKEEEK